MTLAIESTTHPKDASVVNVYLRDQSGNGLLVTVVYRSGHPVPVAMTGRIDAVKAVLDLLAALDG